MRDILVVLVSILAALTSACGEGFQWETSCRPPATGERPGLNHSRIVCRACSEEFFTERVAQVCDGLRRMVSAVDDVRPEQAPVTFHLDTDGKCGPTQSWTGEPNTAHAKKSILGGGANVCLYEVETLAEIEKLGYKFDPAIVKKVDFRITIHETAHIWFVDRFDDKHTVNDHDHSYVENLADLLAFQVTNELFKKDESCDDLREGRTKGNPILWNELCTLGLRLEDVPKIFRRIAADSAARRCQLTISEVETIITEVVGADLSPAFEAANQRRKEAGG